ncbi:hypothetical protein ACLOJK_008037 [Asimina triloba]
MAERGQQWQPQKSDPNLADLRPHPTPSMAMESMQLASSSGVTTSPAAPSRSHRPATHGSLLNPAMAPRTATPREIPKNSDPFRSTVRSIMAEPNSPGTFRSTVQI